MMKRWCMLILIQALATALGLGVGAPDLAKVTVGGDIRVEFSYRFSTGDAEDFQGLHLFDMGDSLLSVSYVGDDKKFVGYAEAGLESATAGNNIFTREAWFQYNAGSWSLLFGQASSICDLYWSNQLLDAARGLDGYGKVNLDRNEQIRLSIGEKYRFMLTIEAPYNGSVWEGSDSFHYLPALATSAELNFGQIQLNPWIHFEDVRWEDGPNSDNYQSLDFGLGITGDFGLVGFTVAAAYGLNTAQATPVISGDPLVVNNLVDSNVKQFSFWGELRV
ncbi:MAG: hypothetical protein JRJ59_09005, partial [Deltaproteobacteria bacterium]|nr:hypothetical protein [Deltaproteobacteria bacterium]